MYVLYACVFMSLHLCVYENFLSMIHVGERKFRLYVHRRSQDSALLAVKEQVKQVGELLKS